MYRTGKETTLITGLILLAAGLSIFASSRIAPTQAQTMTQPTPVATLRSPSITTPSTTATAVPDAAMESAGGNQSRKTAPIMICCAALLLSGLVVQRRHRDARSA